MVADTACNTARHTRRNIAVKVRAVDNNVLVEDYPISVQAHRRCVQGHRLGDKAYARATEASKSRTQGAKAYGERAT